MPMNELDVDLDLNGLVCCCCTCLYPEKGTRLRPNHNCIYARESVCDERRPRVDPELSVFSRMSQEQRSIA